MLDRTNVDIDKLIRSADLLSGRIPVAEIAELHDRVASAQGGVDWRLSACEDAQGRKILTLELAARLVLQCQRCLEPMPEALDHTWRLAVVRSEEDLPELEDEEDTLDFMAVTGLLDVTGLVVEELLLALPMMPRPAAGRRSSL